MMQRGDLSNTHALVRSLLIYSLCVPLAIYLGYSLATPDTRNTLGLVSLLMFVLLLPFLLRCHHLLLITTWNAAAVVPLVNGRPQLWLAMSAMSLLFSLFNRALRGQTRFIPCLPVIFPLIFLAVVIFVTGHLTGGIGLRSAGSGVYGGKRYALLFGAIIGFFALIAQRIPLKQAGKYLALFVLAETTAIVSTFLAAAGPPWHYGLLVFPTDMTRMDLTSNTVAFMPISGIARMISLGTTGQALFFFMLAYYGVRQILDLRHWWRLLLLLTFMTLSLFGGFRSSLILMATTFAVLFCVEGLWRTRLLPAALCGLLLVAAIVLPMADRLPLTVQRSLSFIPYIEIDSVARMDAENSSEWRLRIWKLMLPEVPRYLWLGKGYAINPQDIELATMAAGRPMEASEVAILAGDYHSGPLSVILPLGIFGVVGFLWFVCAGLWVVWRNYAYGDPTLKRVNSYILAALTAKTVFFIVIYGSLYAELFTFTGLIGLSISMNHGICAPKLAPLPVRRPQIQIPNLPAQVLGRVSPRR